MVSKFFICSMQEKSNGPFEYFSSKIQIICEAFSKLNHLSYWEVFGLMEILKILIQFGREFGTTNWPVEKLLHIVTFLKLSQSLKSSFFISFTCKYGCRHTFMNWKPKILLVKFLVRTWGSNAHPFLNQTISTIKFTSTFWLEKKSTARKGES